MRSVFKRAEIGLTLGGSSSVDVKVFCLRSGVSGRQTLAGTDSRSWAITTYVIQTVL